MSRSRLFLTILVVLSALVALSSALWTPAVEAQRATPVEVHGRVLDDRTEQPITGVRVSLYASWGQRLGVQETGADGRFVFQVRHANSVRLEANRLGYEDAETPYLHFDGRTYLEVEIRLDVDAVLLAPLEVVVASVRRSPMFDGFDQRVRRGYGSYFTRSDIERTQPVMVTDLVASVPGVHLRTSGYGQARIVEMSQVARIGACPVQIFMDGRLMNRRGEISIDELVTPSDVEGLEIYRGLASVPAEFYTEWARCGVVAIWTRRGGPRGPGG